MPVLETDDWADRVAETIIDGAIGWDGNIHASRLLVTIPEALRDARKRARQARSGVDGFRHTAGASRAAVEGDSSARYPFAPPRRGRFR